MSVTWLLGDVREQLRMLPAGSVQCVPTSPPYWGLRDYGLPGVEWGDGWVGCLGLEESPERYVAHLVEVFREVRRVLRDDGVVWLNLGDSYIGNGLRQKDLVGIPFRAAFALQADGWYLRAICPWVKRNVMPESVRDRPTTACEYVFLFSKNADYFYDADAVKIAHADASIARSKRGVETNKWSEGAPGQASHSYLQKKDASGIVPEGGRNFRNSDPFFSSLRTILDGGGNLLSDEDGDPLAFVVNPKPFKGAHFATWPPDLVEPMIRAGTSERGACSSCGAPWKRQTGRPCKACGAFIPTQGKSCPDCGHVNDWKAERGISQDFGTTDWSTPGRGTPRKLGESGKQAAVPAQVSIDAGWKPSCSCPPADPVPQVVLDPFGGSGTTSLVAEKLGRDSIYIDANPEYLEIAQRRVGGVQPPPREVPLAAEEPRDPPREPLGWDALLSKLAKQ